MEKILRKTSKKLTFFRTSIWKGFWKGFGRILGGPKPRFGHIFGKVREEEREGKKKEKEREEREG